MGSFYKITFLGLLVILATTVTFSNAQDACEGLCISLESARLSGNSAAIAAAELAASIAGCACGAAQIGFSVALMVGLLAYF